MSKIKESHIKILRQEVEKYFGSPIMYPKDCYALSVAIKDKTGRQISETTLKRIWGLVRSNFNPSKYTLDSLAIFIGHENWEDFINKKLGTGDDVGWKEWNDLKEKADSTTEYSYVTLKNRMGLPFDKVINRRFAEKRLEHFLNSDKTAMAFVAPGGYGKSTIIVKLVEKFFLSENPKYPNDIVWLIDCGIIDSLISKDFNFDSFLLRLMGYDTKQSFRRFFSQHPDYRKGRVILMIDGLNELSGNADKLNSIIDNIIRIIASNEGTEWFKIIITSRANIWATFVRKINQSPNLKDKWFDMDFVLDEPVNNIPLLSKEEIKQILQLNDVQFSIDDLSLNNYEIMDIIRIPYFLQLFVNLYRNLGTDISDIDLLSEFVRKNIIETENGIDKLRLIDYLLFTTNYGIDTSIIKKELVERIVTQKASAYNDLISYGIIHEFAVENKYLEKIPYIKFSHSILFEFLLSNFWMREYGINKNLFETVIDFYKENQDLLCHVLEWLIKYSFKEQKIDVLKNIFNIIEPVLTNTVANYSCHLSDVVGAEIRRNPQLRNTLVRHYATNKGATYYFEKFWDIDHIVIHYSDSIKYYLKHNKKPYQQLFGNAVIFWRYYLEDNTTQVTKQFEKLYNLEIDSLNHFDFNIYLNCQILYQYKSDSNISSVLIDYLLKREEDVTGKNAVRIDSFSYKHIAVIDALSLINRPREVKKISEIIIKNYNMAPEARKSKFYTFLNLLYAKSLLNLQKTGKAFEVFNNIKFLDDESFPVNIKYYWTIRYYLVAVEFKLSENKISEALAYLNKILELSKLLKYKYFQNIASSMLKELKPKNNENF